MIRVVVPAGNVVRDLLDRLSPLQKRLVLGCVDACLVVAAFSTSILLRAEPISLGRQSLVLVAFMLAPLSVLVFRQVGLYRAVLRYAGRKTFEQLAVGVAISTFLLLLLLNITPDTHLLPLRASLRYLFVALVYLGGVRVITRILISDNSVREGVPVALYGAGASGRQLLASLNSGRGFLPRFFLDDNPSIQGREVEGLLVLDPTADETIERLRQAGIKEVYLCLPSASRGYRLEILQRLEAWPFAVKTIPSLERIVSGEARLDELDELAIEDLLERDPVPPNDALLGQCIHNQTVLVTGAGGSIGSELCRQAIEQGANILLMFDSSEYGLYRIEQELRQLCIRKACPTKIVALLGSVTDRERLDRIFKAWAIDTVYHAAAFKHVPLVEHNPVEGIRNNTFGTMQVAELAAAYGVAHFVLISTDKAVRPTNVMGASKRMAELVVQAFQKTTSRTIFSMVRFGNVLGSSGSVVPLFKEQIAAGGPLTVTHPEITRFFMTIPEAVQLVIQAGAMAKGGEVFVLDMGEPMRILDLVYRMVRLSGRTVKDEQNPYGDLPIIFTGLRPGEKLYEELLIGDNVSGTEHPKIMRADEEMLEWIVLQRHLRHITDAMRDHDLEALRQFMQILVKGYDPKIHIADHLWQCQENIQKTACLQANLS